MDVHAQHRGEHLSRDGTPSLSVTTPTYHRPDDLVRALRSVTEGAGAEASDVELVVSDNSTDARSEQVVQAIFDAWPGPSTYVRHDPSRGRTENQNACSKLATGKWQLILHDDDYLLSGGLQQVLDGIATAHPDERVLLFGVRVVDEHGRRLRHQRFRKRRRLAPDEALRRLLTGSSFVRMPAICVRRDAYADVGDFDAALRNADDYDMWIRLFARYGVTTMPSTVSAYVVHFQAATASMFDAEGVEQIHELFRRAERTGVLSGEELRRRKRVFLHQFILAGCFRRMRRGDWSGGRQVLRLFALPEVAELGWSRRWSVVRIVFAMTTAVLSRYTRHATRARDSPRSSAACRTHADEGS